MRTFAALLIPILTAAAPAADAPTGLPPAPMPRPAKKVVPRADRLKAAKDGYQSYCTAWVDALRRAETEKEKQQLLAKLPDPAPYATRAAQLVLEDPADDVALDALAWLVRYRTAPAVQKALAAVEPAKKPAKGEPAAKPVPLDVLAALLEHHVHNPKLAPVARGVYPASAESEAFLGAVFGRTTDPKVRGFAGIALAEMRVGQAENPDRSDADRGKLLAEAEAIYAKLIADKGVTAVVLYTDKDGKEKTLGDDLPGDLRAVRELSVGKPLPEVVGRSLDDRTVRAADYKGKVLVLDVWATWCGPCRAMIPHEREMTARLKDKPFALVSVSCDEEKETLTEFLGKEAMPWTHWWDGKDGAVNKALNVRFYPTVYVIDARGVIRYKNVRDEKLEECVNKLLKEIEGDKGAAGGR